MLFPYPIQVGNPKRSLFRELVRFSLNPSTPADFRTTHQVVLMAVPAGSKGGYWGATKDTRADLGTFVRELPLYADAGPFASVKTLGVYVNSICNLACEHCYYTIENGYRGAGGMDEPKLLSVLDAALALETRLFAFVGKEIFIPGRNGAEKTLAAMQRLAEARVAGRDLMIGGVTNGHFLHRRMEELQEVGLDFLDISFEGHEEAIHDRIRGEGSFRKSVKNLRRCIREDVAEKIFVATTLLQGNVDSLANILDFHHDYGARHYSVMPVVSIQDDAQAVSIADLRKFLSVHLPAKAASLNNDEPVQVVVDLDSYVIDRDLDFFEDFFEGCTVKIDRLDNVILSRTVGGNVELAVRVSLPDPCNSYGCVTHDGLYFDKGGCLFMKNGYEHHALGKAEPEQMADLLDQHRTNAVSLLEGYGSGLFAEMSDDLLNESEDTAFYALPQLQ